MSLFEADLARGRQWSRIGDAYEVTRKPRGLSLSEFPAVPFAAMEAIPQGGAYLPEFTMKAPKTIASGTYFERGDVLVSKITPSFENGKQALIRELAVPFGYATTEVIPLHPRSTQHDPRLVFFYLLHPDVRSYIAERMEGSTGRQRVPESVLLDVPMPLLEHSDQISIADALEAMQRASTAESMCERFSLELKQATMRALFTRGLRGEAQKETEIGPGPRSWMRTPIASLGRIITGNTPPTNDPTNYVGGEIPFTAPGDIEHGRPITMSEKRITAKGLKSVRPIEAGATCVVCIGSSIGKVGYVTSGLCATNQQINSVLPYGEFNSPYVFHLITYWADYVRSHASPSPVPILSKGVLEKLEVLSTTDKDEQQEIANILDAIDRKIDLHRRKRAILDKLFKALLHKLMTGEIRVADLDLSSLTAIPPTETAA